MDRISVEASASSANLGPGFDVFALALESPKDTISLRIGKSTGRAASVRLTKLKGLPVPRSEAENGACIVCLEIAKGAGFKGEILVELEKRVPIGMGMGSSGASAAAAAVATNGLLGLGLGGDELIRYAGIGEGATSGARHYDNVAASILGGFVIVRGGERPTAVAFDPPKDAAICMVTPVVELPRRKTEYARSLLPKSVPLETLVENLGNASLMVSGFARKDIKLVGRGMIDRAVQQARKSMIPGYDRVTSAALGAGAEGVCISGAGPSMLAIVENKGKSAEKVLGAMVRAFEGAGARSTGYITRIGGGARVVKGG